VTISVSNDCTGDAPDSDLRIVNEIPDRVLHIEPRHDLTTIHPSSNEILIDDPFNKVHCFWVIDDSIKLLPIPDHSSIVPLPREHFRVAIEAPAPEIVPVQRVVPPDFEPVLRVGLSEVGSEAGPLWERETLLVDGFGWLITRGRPLHNGVRGEVTTIQLRCGNSELNCSSGQIFKGPLELSRDGISHRFGKPSEMNGSDCPVSRGHIADDKITVFLPVKEHLPRIVVLTRNQRERAVV
jgi:hypothetical protein